MINKFNYRKAAALVCVLTLTASVIGTSAEATFSSSYHDTDRIVVNVDATNETGEISPYIYGINAESDISGLSVNAIKQTDPRISSYNWETNYSNSGTGNISSNTIDMVATYPPGRWVEPALYTEYLLTKAKRYNVSSRYVTLQLLDGVAADDSGNLYAGETDSRWLDVSPTKVTVFEERPDVDDNAVYMDEYVSYLVNRYGYAVDGGINGYFLDSEPENWYERFPSAVSGKVTADDLATRSIALADSVKQTDPTALVYGPSISGIEAFTSLKNPDDWAQYSREYSWFIDYYLMRMNDASHFAGTRLLDVLDIHYSTEATNGLFDSVINGTDWFSHNTRMQAPRIFWDSTYTENSTIAILHNQHIPLIPTLEASINMYYPGTELSFSEYNFGGGDHISGGIATADTLGIFAKYGVHMACLKPNTEDISFHKAAINIYTNYDGMGSGFGTTMVESDNGGDIMSSVYAAVDDGDSSVMRMVMMNKNQNAPKNAEINISSDVYYENAEVYFFNKENSEIVRLEEDIAVSDNSLEFEMNPLSVYMLVFRSSPDELEDIPDTEASDVSSETTADSGTVSGTSTEEFPNVIISEETVPPEHVSAETLSSAGTTVNIDVGQLPEDEGGTPVVTEVPEGDESAEESESESRRAESPEDNIKVPMAVKVIVCILLGMVVLTMIYVIFATGKKSDR